METIVAITSILTSSVAVIMGLRFYFRFGRQEENHWGWLFLVLSAIGLSFSEFAGGLAAFNSKVDSNLSDIFVILAEVLLTIGFVRLFNRELVEEKSRQEELEHSLSDTEKLLTATRRLSESLDVKKTLTNFIQRALVLANADLAVIYLSKQVTLLEEQYIAARRTGPLVVSAQKIGAMTEKILASGSPLILPDFHGIKKGDHSGATLQLGTFAGFPLKEGENSLGVLFVGYEKQHPIDQDEMILMVNLADHGTLAIRNALLYQEVEELSLTDPGTGLANRRQFDQTLEKELARARRYDESLSLLIIDLDHFKSINDSWGHPAGDAAVRMVAGIMQKDIRLSDLATRLGGDELALLLPRTSLEEAFQLAERLRVGIGEARLDWNGQSVQTTCSVGVYGGAGSSLPEEPETFYRLADQALYKAKEKGRNCVSGV